MWSLKEISYLIFLSNYHADCRSKIELLGYPKNVLSLKLVTKIRFQLHYANLFPRRYPSSFHLRLRRKRLVIILQGVSNPFLIAWQTSLEFIVIIICFKCTDSQLSKIYPFRHWQKYFWDWEHKGELSNSTFERILKENKKPFQIVKYLKLY